VAQAAVTLTRSVVRTEAGMARLHGCRLGLNQEGRKVLSWWSSQSGECASPYASSAERRQCACGQSSSPAWLWNIAPLNIGIRLSQPCSALHELPRRRSLHRHMRTRRVLQEPFLPTYAFSRLLRTKADFYDLLPFVRFFVSSSVQKTRKPCNRINLHSMCL
jgi:hypothetical protein